jgi:prevent-host-death family protein
MHAMARSTWSLQDAKNNFSAIVRAAEREPQTVTKRGRPAVVVIAVTQYARMSDVRRSEAASFVQHRLTMPADDGDFERLGGELREPGT